MWTLHVGACLLLLSHQEVNKDAVLETLKAGDLTKLVTELAGPNIEEKERFGAKSFLAKQQSTESSEAPETPSTSGAAPPSVTSVVSGSLASQGDGLGKAGSGKKQKVWDKARFVHDEKMRAMRLFGAFRESVETAINDATLALEGGKGLAAAQPAVYRPRLETLESRLSCLCAIVAGPEDTAGSE